MNRIRREERGMTLVELLAAMAIALIVSLAAFSLIEAVMKRTGDVESFSRDRSTGSIVGPECAAVGIWLYDHAEAGGVGFFRHQRGVADGEALVQGQRIAVERIGDVVGVGNVVDDAAFCVSRGNANGVEVEVERVLLVDLLYACVCCNVD